MNPGTGTQFLGVGSRLSAQAKPGQPATSPTAFEEPFLLESSLQPSLVLQLPGGAGASAKGCTIPGREMTAAPGQWMPAEARP